MVFVIFWPYSGGYNVNHGLLLCLYCFHTPNRGSPHAVRTKRALNGLVYPNLPALHKHLTYWREELFNVNWIVHISREFD